LQGNPVQQSRGPGPRFAAGFAAQDCFAVRPCSREAVGFAAKRLKPGKARCKRGFGLKEPAKQPLSQGEATQGVAPKKAALPAP